METFTVTLEEDLISNELLLPIPPLLLEKLGWKEGDTLICSFIDNETLTIYKK